MHMLRLASTAMAISALCSAYSAPPAPPCKTPQELLRAVEFALKHQDTNFFWSLYCWTNIPPSSAASHKVAFQEIYFSQNPAFRPTYSHFELRPLLPEHKTEIRRKDGTQIKFSPPTLGLVGFQGGDIYYGIGPDGYYWLSARVKIPPETTNSLSPPTNAPPKTKRVGFSQSLPKALTNAPPK